MRKKLLCLFPLIFLTLALFACSDDNVNPISELDVSLIIENEEVTTDTTYLTLTLANNSSREIVFGDTFRVEFWDGEHWVDLMDESQVWNMIAYYLDQDESETFIRDLTLLEANLEPGERHRIVIPFDNNEVYTEFEVY